MRAGWNVALQAVVLVAFAVLRLSAAGWLLLILIVTGLGLLTLVPLVLSVAAVRRGVLRSALVTPFVACDLTLLVGALLMPDGGDSGESWAPLWTFLGGLGTEVPAWYAPVAFAAILGYLGSTLWLIVAFCATAPRRSGPPPLPPGFAPPPGFGTPPAGFGAPAAGFGAPVSGPGGPPAGQAPWASYPGGPGPYPGGPAPYPPAQPWSPPAPPQTPRPY